MSHKSLLRNVMVAAFVSVPLVSSAVESMYAFRQRLATVHRADRRDRALSARADEFEFRHGSQIVISDDAQELVRLAAEDFRDYLSVSMDVNASVREVSVDQKPGLIDAVRVFVSAAKGMKPFYTLDVGSNVVSVTASDAAMAAQALYHLEDRMNLRRGPFLKKGLFRRAPLFPYRFVFSGFGNNIFPDAHLSQLAHHGYSGIEVWLKDYDVISQGVRQDVNDLLKRAKRYGLTSIFQPRNRAFVHPEDPRAPEMYDKAYGMMARYYPAAGAVSFVGEVCAFPSRDERSNGANHRDRSTVKPGDKRPFPGWFPCRDWVDWVKMVRPIMHRYNPDCRFLFSTYNWGFQDEKARADLIESLPRNITLIPTFEMFERHVKRNGLVSPVADYSLAFPGPGRYFATEAAQAKKLGIELWSNCNSSGLTWDFGNIPYQPAPWQWKKRWDALKEANRKWNLTGLRESHEYGWYPSFISELEKEYMWEGCMDFDEHVRAIAARDFGEGNVDAAVKAWRAWSRAAEDYVPTDDNQYRVCRIGPAYPFNYFGKPFENPWKPPAGFPLEPGAVFGICHFDYTKPIGGLGTFAVNLNSPDDVRKEIELFESQAEDYRIGAEIFRGIAASLPPGRRDEAVRMAALGEYLMCTCRTSVHMKRGLIAWRNGDRREVERLARLEYENAKAALKAVDDDSRLGWLASSGYTGGRPQIEWKLRLMSETYGLPHLKHKKTLSAAGDGWTWTDGRSLRLEGRPFADADGFYSRLPAYAKPHVDRGTWAMSRCPAGMSLLFTTTSDRLKVRWSLTESMLAMTHMPATGVSGVDLYRRTDDGLWMFVKAGFPRKQNGNEFEVQVDPGRPYRLYLPLYNGLSSLELGVASGSSIMPADLPADLSVKPVVFYGGSSTQGACVSRPGNAWMNIAGRILDSPTVCMGFNGQGKMIPYEAELLARIDAAAYCFLSLGNMNGPNYAAEAESFLRRLHELRPDVPIVFGAFHYPLAKDPEKHAFVPRLKEKLRREDLEKWARFDIVTLDEMCSSDCDGTVDGGHPNDYGSYRLAEAFSAVIRRVVSGSGKRFTVEK